MDLARPLTLVAPTVDADVLAVLAGAEATFTGRQVHQIAGRHSERGVRNSLHRLAGQGIVTSQRVGGADLYGLNRQHLAAPYIVALAGLRTELLAHIRAKLADWTIQPVFVALFGSAARGDMQPDSDIDLLVVRQQNVDVEDSHWRGQLDDLSVRVTAWTGNDTRVLELSENEARRGFKSGEAVLVDVQAEGVVLYERAGYLSSQRRKVGTRRV